MRLENTVLQILSNSTIHGNIVRLNNPQLDRDLYLKVDKALKYIGGKWNRKCGGHVFDSDPTNLLEQVILTASVDKPENNALGYFHTPKNVISQMIELANIKENMDVLEPSAGQGHIAEELKKLNCNLTLVELEPVNRSILEKKGLVLSGDDFLKFTGSYDRIVMNPPFEKQADIEHVNHAYSLLKNNGRLVSIMSAGVTFRDNTKTNDFRKLVESNGEIIPLPQDSFKESGTIVNTVMVVLNSN